MYVFIYIGQMGLPKRQNCCLYFVLVGHNIVISCIKYDENREYEYATLMDKI